MGSKLQSGCLAAWRSSSCTAPSARSTTGAISTGSTGSALPVSWAAKTLRDELEDARDHALVLGREVAPRPFHHRAQAGAQPVGVVGFGLVATEAGEDVGDLPTVLLAGRALAARLHGEEAGHAGGHGDEVVGVVEHDEPGRAESGSGRRHRLVAERRVELRLRQDRIGDPGHRRDETAPQDRPSPQLVDDGAQRRAHRHLTDRAARRRAGDRAHDGPRRLGRADRAEPFRSVDEDAGHVGDRLGVVDERRRGDRVGARHLDAGRRGRAVARPRRRRGGTAARAEGRAPVPRAPRAAPSPRRTGTRRALPAPRPRCPRSIPRRRSRPPLLAARRISSPKLRLQCDHDPISTDGVGGDERAFEHAVRVAAQYLAILERSRLTLGGVDDDRCGEQWRCVGRDGAPLAAGREPAATPPAQPRRLDLVDDGRRAEPPRRVQPLAAAAVDVRLQGRDRFWIEDAGQRSQLGHHGTRLPDCAHRHSRATPSPKVRRAARRTGGDPGRHRDPVREIVSGHRLFPHRSDRHVSAPVGTVDVGGLVDRAARSELRRHLDEWHGEDERLADLSGGRCPARLPRRQHMVTDDSQGPEGARPGRRRGARVRVRRRRGSSSSCGRACGRRPCRRRS